MNINPVNFTRITIGAQKPQIQRQQNIPSDTFVRTTNTEKQETNAFIKWVEDNDFIQSQLPMLLLDKENIIGSGFSHKTYAIPNNDDYILRTANYNTFNDVDYRSAEIIDTEDKNLKINIGQQVARIELKTHSGYPLSIEVLKKQTGKPIGEPPAQALYNESTGTLRDDVESYESLNRKQNYAKSLEKLAQLPVESYEKLISDIKSAGDAGYSFDHLNSNNLLLDEEKQSINLIDMDKNKIGINYGNILYALTNINYFSTFSSRTGDNPMPQNEIEQAIDNTVTITQKYILAMRAQGVKFDKKNVSMEFHDLLRSFPLSIMCGSFDNETKWKYFEQNGVA
ncbi:hypothetical protein IJ182_08655 [bacterium]|nr:hypothetical protein [bacterium]